MKQTKEQLVKDLDYYSKESSLLHCVLNDVMNGKVKWFRFGCQKLGVSRANGAAGALVIHQFKAVTITGDKQVRNNYSCAYFWEHWFPKVREQSCNDKESTDLRTCAFMAHNWILNQQTNG
jgi:hypothetical protein